MRRNKKLATLILMSVMTAFAIAAGRSSAPVTMGGQSVAPHAGTAGTAQPAGADHVRRSRLFARLTGVLDALGDRFERGGKERLTLAGTITRAGAAPTPFVLVREYPDRLRLEEQGTPHRVLVFDGRGPATDLTRAEEETVETLVYDTPEHLFDALMRVAAAVRFLGARFRADDGTNPNYKGPYFDVYQVNEDMAWARGARARTKFYAFDSDTMLPAGVRYEIRRGGETVRVEVRMGGWMKVEGQQIPGRVERLENGAPVFRLAVTSAAVGARQDDALFSAPAQ